MKSKGLILVIILMLISISSCKNQGHAILTVTIDNEIIEYTFWSMDYDVTWSETAGYNCTLVQDTVTVVDGDNKQLYSNVYTKNIQIQGSGTQTQRYSGLLIGIYQFEKKPVTLIHSTQFRDTASGNLYSAEGKFVLHSN